MGREVDDRIVSLEHAADGVRVKRVDGHRRRALTLECGTFRRRATNRGDVMPEPDEQRNDAAADHAGGSGQEDTHREPRWSSSKL